MCLTRTLTLRNASEKRKGEEGCLSRVTHPALHCVSYVLHSRVLHQNLTLRNASVQREGEEGCLLTVTHPALHRICEEGCLIRVTRPALHHVVGEPHSRVPRSRLPHYNNASEHRKSEEGCVMRVIRPAHHRARNEVGAATGDFSHTQQIFSTEPYLILSRILYSVLKDFEAPPSLCEYILVTKTTTRRRELSGNCRDERLAKFIFFPFQKNLIRSMALSPLLLI